MRKIVALILIIFLSFCGYSYIINGINPLSMFTPCDFKVEKDNVETKLTTVEPTFSFYTNLSNADNKYELYFYKLADVNGLQLSKVTNKSTSNEVKEVVIPSITKSDYLSVTSSYLNNILDYDLTSYNIYEERQPISKFNTKFIIDNNYIGSDYVLKYEIISKQINELEDKFLYDELIEKFENRNSYYTNTRKWSEEFKYNEHRLEANKINKKEGYKDKLNGYNYFNQYNSDKTLKIREKSGITYEAALYGNFDLYGILALNEDKKKALYTHNLYLKENGLSYNINTKRESLEKFTLNEFTYLSMSLNYGLIDETLNEITITFDTLGGSTIPSQTIDLGEKAIEPIIPVKDGYKFDGWYEDQNYNKKFNFNTNLFESLTLYAKWNKLDNFNPNGVNILVGNRHYYRDCLQFEILVENNTGVTIYGFKELYVSIYVDGVLRAQALFKDVDLGVLTNGSSRIHKLNFSFNTIDKDWWNNNQGVVSMHTICSYTLNR